MPFRTPLSIALLVAIPIAAQETDDSFDPIDVNVADAIDCKVDARTYNSFALSLDSSSDKGASRRGWRKIKGTNPFLYEYRLPKPILIAGQYPTRHIALASTSIIAILDLPDPTALAKAEEIENAADPEAFLEGMIADGALTPEQAKSIPLTNKFLGERVLVDEAEHDQKLKVTFQTLIKRVISTVSSHPGKTLYGCSYSIAMTDDAEVD